MFSVCVKVRPYAFVCPFCVKIYSMRAHELVADEQHGAGGEDGAQDAPRFTVALSRRSHDSQRSTNLGAWRSVEPAALPREQGAWSRVRPWGEVGGPPRGFFKRK